MSKHFIVLASASVVVGALLTTPHAQAADQAGEVPRCFGARATIVGTPGDDTIRGTAGPDVIYGAGGGDFILGLGGNDRICTGPMTTSWQTVRGGGGADRIRGGGRLSGGPGDDYLFSGQKNNQSRELAGGAGDDVLRAVGTKRNYGVFWPGPGNDTIIGDPDQLDRVLLRSTSRGVVVDLRAGTATGMGRDRLISIDSAVGSHLDDVLIGNAGPNAFYGSSGNDVILLGAGSDTTTAGPGDDLVRAGPGDDRFLGGGPGIDTLFGGAGDDVLIEPRLAEPNMIAGGAGRDACWGGYQVPPSIERGCESHQAP